MSFETITEQEQRNIDADQHLWGSFFAKTQLKDNYIRMFWMRERLPILLNVLAIDMLDWFMFYVLFLCDDIKIEEKDRTVVYWG